MSLYLDIIFIFLFSAIFANVSTSHDELNKKALFSIIAPKIIHPNKIYNVSVFTEKRDEVVVVRLKLECGSVLYSTEENEIPPGKNEVIGVDVNDLAGGTCAVSIKVKLLSSEWDSPESVYNDTKTIHVAKKSTSILIQLDKPIYKPGEIVKFRIIFLNRQLRPIIGEGAEIKISDPQKNTIRLYKNQSITKGLFSGEMKLSSEPNLGDWEIGVQFQEEEEKLEFSVAQYVLPKFKVEVILPKFIVNDTSKIKAEIKATYTYGKGVQGQVTVKLISPHDYFYPYYLDKRRKRFAGYLNRVKREPIGPHPLKIRPPPISSFSTTTPFPDKLITKPINGSVFVDLDIPNDLQIMRNEYNENSFTIEATVTETVTGKQQNGTGKVKMYAYPFKIEEIDKPAYYKPGFPLKFTFKVSSQDGTPITDEKDAFKISHGFSYDDQGSTFRSPISSTGIVTFTVTTPSNENLRLEPNKVSYKGLTKTFSVPQKMSSPTKTYIQVTVMNIEENIVKVKSNKPMKALNYIAIVQGNVVDSGREDFLSEKTEASLIINPNKETSCGPKVTILVYAIFGNNNEIVVDSTTYTVKTTLSNYLSIKLSKEKAEPGDNITLLLETNSNSIIALRGVDQSVLLLKEERNIDSNRIDEVLKSFEDETLRRKMWGGSPAARTFEDSGIMVFTNCHLEEAPGYHPWAPRLGGGAGRARPMPMMKKMGRVMNAVGAPAPPPPPEMYSDSEDSMAFAPKLVSPTRVRDKFPESWIWETIEATNTQMEIPKTVPDTLTSWVLTGFSLNPELGIGVNVAPQILETFRPFFISLNLPYSVVKGEIFALQVLLHNYMDEEVVGIVTLNNENKHMKFLEDKDGDPVKTSNEKSVKIPPNQVSSLTFVIIPVKIGEIKLEFVAKTTMAGDALSQPLTVKPPGHKQSKNSAVLLDVRSGTPVTLKLTTMFPEKRVADGDSVTFSVIGDLLGSTISNLDKLIQMPCGCGEQNMLNFVPDIVILDYLKASGILKPGIKRTAINFLEIGYQRELTYRHVDGSFSAFGQTDSSGSTWLTAFVARSFISAKKYITIDENIITDALEYLSKLQNENGMFIEKGQVIHSGMQGGANSGIALTAYVLLSFLEASEMMSISFKYNSIVKKALEYLSKKMVDLEDPYPIILICYAFHVANSDRKDAMFKKVEKLARHENQHTYWYTGKDSVILIPEEHGDMGPSGRFLLRNIVRHEEKPVDVEMTAYALQTYLLRNKVVDSVPIAKWLLTQRNSNGGFLSTQDTVVGLTALAKFAMSTKSPDSQLQINLQHAKEDQRFTINKDTAMVLQDFSMPPDTKEITITATGKGMAMAQLSWNFYLEDGALKPAFSITTQVKKSESIKGMFSLNICTAYMSEGVSNMALMEVRLPSGYGFETEELSGLLKIPSLVRYEEENDHTKLNIYFTSLNNTKSCVEMKANRLFTVAKLAPASIIVYDYYDTTKKARAFYEPPAFSLCDMCGLGSNICGDKVNCVYRDNRFKDRGLL